MYLAGQGTDPYGWRRRGGPERLRRRNHGTCARPRATTARRRLTRPPRHPVRPATQPERQRRAVAPRLTVLGTGYLGATHAVCMAELGFEVLGLDVDERKVKMLSNGEVPFYEPGLDELLRKTVASGKVRFTTSYDEVADFGDVHFICAGTPQQKGEYAADMRQVNSVVDELAPRLRRAALVVGKSPLPSGPAVRLARELREKAPAGDAVELAWNPEFLREGF